MSKCVSAFYFCFELNDNYSTGLNAHAQLAVWLHKNKIWENTCAKYIVISILHQKGSAELNKVNSKYFKNYNAELVGAKNDSCYILWFFNNYHEINLSLVATCLLTCLVK